jgi:AraC-like DNA-binding protein
MGNKVTINSLNYSQYNYLIPEINYCAEDKYESFWELKERTIKDYEFIFITRGAGQFIIDGKQYNVKPNDLILVEPYKAHCGKSIELPFHFLCMHIEIYAVENVLVSTQIQNNRYDDKSLVYQKAQLEFPELTVVRDSSYIHLLLKRIINESTTRPPGFGLIISSLATELLINLFREKNSICDLDKIPDQIQSLIDYIKLNHMNNIKLSNLADYVHLQPAYISNLFRKHTGNTITDFIKHYRLLAAKKLLLETERKVEDIAGSVGFYDVHHFSKVFKEEEGLAPSQYRTVKRKY